MEAVKGSGALAFEGLFAILPESNDCSYDPTNDELNNEGEGDAGEVESGLCPPPIAKGEWLPLERRRKPF